MQLNDSQKEGYNAIISSCTDYEITDKRMIAYILATAWHETAQTMQPIEEYGKGKGHPYGSKIKQSGQTYETPDFIYYGRGYTQNTWYENYQMLSNQSTAKLNGWDFLNHPELLLQERPSLWATIHCMYKGLYTGVGLPKYFNDTTTDYINARKIINGLDSAEKIAGYAEDFFNMIN